MNKIWNIPEIQLIPLAEVNEPRSVLLITQQSDWERVRGQLRLSVMGQLEPLSARLEHWDTLSELSGELCADVLYAVGGRLVIDAAKYLAHKFSLPLVCIPIALDSDAFLTPSANIQHNGWVRIFQGQPAERVIIDFDTIAAAPAERRARGLAQVLSLATAAEDWKLAEQRGKNPPGKDFDQCMYEATQAILRNGLQCASAAGKGNPQGLKQLLDCLCLEVQLRNQAGHDRLAKGSEHYFAYAAQKLPGIGLDWQDLLGQGILHAAEWQGQDKSRLEEALRAAYIPVDRVPAQDVVQIQKILPSFCEQHNLDYGIACEI
jgi:glycerol-1-phosphate dehydrogenase [NAD(P)+]